jgi:hypothetical protein
MLSRSRVQSNKIIGGGKMALSNCVCCKKIIRNSNEEFCETCKAQLDIEFDAIKDYLEEHPGATIQQVSKELEIPVHRIKIYLRDERLEIIGGMGEGTFFLTCKKCSAPIKTGSYCEGCSRGLASAIQSTTNDMKTKMSSPEKKNNEAPSFKYINKDKK